MTKHNFYYFGWEALKFNADLGSNVDFLQTTKKILSIVNHKADADYAWMVVLKL